MSNTKIKLLTDGGFDCMDTVDFNTIFEAEYYISSDGKCLGVHVSGSSLIAAGGAVNQVTAACYFFSKGLNEYETVEGDTNEQANESTTERCLFAEDED